MNVAGCDHSIIDAHFHHHGRERVWRSALDGARRRGIEQIWVSDVPWHSPAYPVREEVEALNAMTAAIVREHAELFRGFVYVDPKDEQRALGDVRRAVDKQGMIGVKLWISCLCDDERVFPIASYAQERRLPMLVHAWDKVTGNYEFEGSAAHVAGLARLFPELPVIMAHHGGDWLHACRHVQPFDNVSVDVSGSVIDHGLVDYMASVLGPRRVLFGTDNSDFHACRAKVAAARLDEEAKRLVFCGNALRILERIR